MAGALQALPERQRAAIVLRFYASTEGAVLNGVSAFGHDDVWAVGTSDNVTRSLIEKWNGSSWQRQQSPHPSPTFNGLADITRAGVSLRSVGAFNYEDTERALILRSCQ